MLPLAVPLAVCEAAEELAGDSRRGESTDFRCGVKWPNDVLVDGRKLAGILVEARPQDGWAVVGVGLNLTISPDEFPPTSATRLFRSPARARGVGGGPPEPPRCCSGETPPDPPRQPKS